MKRIGGTTKAVISVSGTTTNAIGEQVKTWTDAVTLKGWLDYVTGDSRMSPYHAKVQDSTHIFLCDWVRLPDSVTSETARVTIDGKRYAIRLIDDPMGLHQQLEIYLRYTGAQ